MQKCLFYYKSQTMARNAAEILKNYNISVYLTKPPRDDSLNYCTYAVKVYQDDCNTAHQILANYSMPPIKIRYTNY